jgi:hypothetical protein
VLFLGGPLYLIGFLGQFNCPDAQLLNYFWLSYDFGKSTTALRLLPQILSIVHPILHDCLQLIPNSTPPTGSVILLRMEDVP